MDRRAPQVLNSDDDEVVFHTLRFPLAPGATERRVVIRLGRLAVLRRETATFWNWCGPPPATRLAAATGGKAVVWNVTLDDGSVVLGNVELLEDAVVLSVSSAARAGRGHAMLADAFAGLVAAPLIEIQTVEQMKDAAPRASADTAGPVLSPEAGTKLVHDMLDRQYRALLDEPVPMLGNRTPRAAARNARGQQNLAVWLKHLENHSSHSPDPDDPMATYDFTWLWRELKVEQLRS